ncbi:MAG: PDZ domain-containing protein [Chloroflexi bacterium]|nr:MAG: PDZ domain-containing protein [Chloroflexota bacterium]
MFYPEGNNNPTQKYNDPPPEYQPYPGPSMQPQPGVSYDTGAFGVQSPLPQPPAIGKAKPPARGGCRSGAIVALTLAILLVFGVGLFAGWQFGRDSANSQYSVGALQTGTNAQPPIPPVNGSSVETVREAVIARMRPAVVQVNVATNRGNALGSGVIIDQRGYIVTNNHVVQGAQNIMVVLFNGTRSAAQLTGADSADDLAVIKINPPPNIVVGKLGDSSKLSVGQDVLAIGNPLGITQTTTSGIISALNRNVSEPGGATIPNAIQTDAAINPGNSGGALVNLRGELIGIPTLTALDPEFKTPANGVGFAIPSNRVALIAPQIIATGRVQHTGRAVLNVQIAPVDPIMQAQNNLAVDHGVLIVETIAGGAADKAGLRRGDVIVQIDNQAVNDVSALSDALVNKNPGDKISVKLFRGNQQLTVNVILNELQAGG